MKAVQNMIHTVASDTKTYTLYLIRHGEASHNIKEKEAIQKAKQEAMEEGWAQDSSEVQRLVEEARQQVLDDPHLFDAPLSDGGKEDARKCHERLQTLAKKYAPPTQVLVSPLQRTLQTANLAFPDHANIHVREKLRERMTGYACDSRHRSETLRKIKSFQRFSMFRIQMGSVVRRSQPLVDDDEDSAEEPEGIFEMDQQPRLPTRSKPIRPTVEQRAELRERTKLLFNMLQDFDDTSIAVVSHKGYLRELERGQFGIKESPEYGNGEVRVYEVKTSKCNHKLLKIRRLD
jgi:broad specificity phosphatase PhoE